MTSISVDFTRPLGKIKPMHGVGQPPFWGTDYSLCDYLAKAHVPFSRLHDVGGMYGGNLYVDIPNLFRDFSADPADPESYDFAFTDLLITALCERGIEPFFRLGVTIENYHRVKAYRIFPPADYDKWARICEGIIRHYTEGWANGFHYNITYWEIWNEPDNGDVPTENSMWRGSAEDYYRLYAVTAKHLKSLFPHLKFGGYASCGFYAVTDPDTKAGNCPPIFRYIHDFYHNFLAYVREHDCPLDFFSWHSYRSIEETVIWADYARKTLDEAGFTHTEHTLNEWNCQPELFGTVKHAALTCGMMLALQNTSLDSAMFYDAGLSLWIYAGVFNSLTRKPFPAYYTFLAFDALYQQGTQVSVEGLPEGVYACAARGEDSCLVMANVTESTFSTQLCITGAGKIAECKIIREGAVWEDHCFDGNLPPESVVYIRFEA